jgi:hypothetical protein
MIRLALALYAIVGTALAGSLVIAALTLGRVDAGAIVGGAGLGFVLAVPVSVLVARAILRGRA